MNIVEPVLELNPDALAPEEIHRRAWEVVEPLSGAGRTEALDRFKSLLGTGDGKAATKPEDIVKAARYGRVDTLFVAADDHLWGRFDEAADRIVAHGTAQTEDEDLLDYAAVQTFLQGGHVNVLPKQDLPGNGPIAAILRY
jgi:stalled ribosome rescue protein Dom34